MHLYFAWNFLQQKCSELICLPGIPIISVHSNGEAYLPLSNEQCYLWNSGNAPSHPGARHQLFCAMPSIPDQALTKAPSATLFKFNNLHFFLTLIRWRQGKTLQQLRRIICSCLQILCRQLFPVSWPPALLVLSSWEYFCLAWERLTGPGIIDSSQFSVYNDPLKVVHVPVSKNWTMTSLKCVDILDTSHFWSA